MNLHIITATPADGLRSAGAMMPGIGKGVGNGGEKAGEGKEGKKRNGG